MNARRQAQAKPKIRKFSEPSPEELESLEHSLVCQSPESRKAGESSLSCLFGLFRWLFSGHDFSLWTWIDSSVSSRILALFRIRGAWLRGPKFRVGTQAHGVDRVIRIREVIEGIEVFNTSARADLLPRRIARAQLVAAERDPFEDAVVNRNRRAVALEQRGRRQVQHGRGALTDELQFLHRNVIALGVTTTDAQILHCLFECGYPEAAACHRQELFGYIRVISPVTGCAGHAAESCACDTRRVAAI